MGTGENIPALGVDTEQRESPASCQGSGWGKQIKERALKSPLLAREEGSFDCPGGSNVAKGEGGMKDWARPPRAHFPVYVSWAYHTTSWASISSYVKWELWFPPVGVGRVTSG